MLKVMKILGLVVCLFGSIANVCLADAAADKKSDFFVVKLGFDQAGKHELDVTFLSIPLSESRDVDSGFSVEAEWQHIVNNNAVIGLGINHQLARSPEGYEGEFNFSSVYASGRLNINSALFFVGRLGYNLYQGNEAYESDLTLEGGGYYAVGLALTHNRLETELLYEVNNGKVDSEEDKVGTDVTYSKVLLTIGYRI